ncbi:MAG: Transcriptional regulator, IclR family [Firmicutes bacterium]|nr:Transcriptional regulator, IclR family [Bacillota bacterium]
MVLKLKNNTSNYILSSVDNALEVLDLLSSNYELSATEVGRMLNIGKSTAFRLLTTLENRGYVKKNSNNKYRLGMKFAFMGSIVLDRMEIIKHSHPFLEELTKDTNETTHLVILEEDNNVRFVDKVTSPSTIRMESFIGLKRPAYCTATGKVLLAYKDENAINEYLKNTNFIQYTQYTVKNAEELREILMQIRKDGYGIDANESEIGLTCYAAPILDPSGKAIAAISVSGPSERMYINKQKLISSIKSTAYEISNSI